ncbi:zinc finger protein ZPR1 isoform X3 [Artibeus jamaicensis]|uniref:zinc finger protein ZPR1 isoform X3 n=1 Tax=Artibeus jamaicensis TaxID=9417 RepID=UPI00187C39B4|nr:zinc finger protein ZPR1 isoform X3 [Artibeus jamaicensis]
MSASGAVETGLPAVAATPSPTPARAPVPGRLFRPISAEDEEQQPTEIESLCMNCYRNGMTRLLLTKIPFFREIIVSSFSCEHCGWNNTEIQSAGRIQDQGIRYTLTVRAPEDMNREVVKTDSATTRIPELDFEIPAFSQKGALTTVEGLISRAISGLEQDQPTRRTNKEAIAERIDEFIVKLKELKHGASPFTLIIDDPSGNSFVENPHAPQKDDALVITHYNRTPQQEEMLGLQAETPEEKPEEEDLRNEVLQFNTNCPECNAPAQTNMKLVQIPHFKEVIIMATNCEYCGHRTNEVKSGGAVEPLGTRINLHITDPSDMTRDLLKVTKNPFTLGDSSSPGQMNKLQEFSQRVDQIIEGKMKAHFIMNDPAGNSYLQNVYAPEDDPEMKVEYYERTFEQNEELGLNDMRTEGYETSLVPQR